MRKIGLGVMMLSMAAWAATLGVDDAVRFALAHSPDVQIAKLSQKELEQKRKVIEGALRPRLDLQGIGGKGLSKMASSDTDDFNLLEGSMHATQLLYDFGRTRSQIDAAQTQVKIARADLKETLLETIYRVKAAYYDLLAAKASVAVYQKQVALQQAQLDRANKFYKAGIRSIIDVTDAKANLALAKRNLAAAKHRVRSVQATLQAVLGGWPKNMDIPEVSTDRIVAKAKDLNSSKCDETTLWPDLLKLRGRRIAANEAIEGAKLQIASLKTLYYPSFHLQADGTARHVDDVMRLATPETQADAGVTMQWNLFNGMSDRHKIEAAQIAWLKAKSAFKKVQIALRADLTDACTRYAGAFDDLHLGLAVLEANRQKLYEATKRYESDLADYIALQNAQLGYIKSLNDVTSSFFAWLKAKAYLDRVVGR